MDLLFKCQVKNVCAFVVGVLKSINGNRKRRSEKSDTYIKLEAQKRVNQLNQLNLIDLYKWWIHEYIHEYIMVYT